MEVETAGFAARDTPTVPVMSIRDRLKDAETLFNAGRHEGALLMVLIAAAASAKKRYPRINGKPSEEEVFCKFVSDGMEVILGGLANKYTQYFDKRQLPIEKLLYVFARSTLIHDADLPKTLEFVAGTGFYIGVPGDGRLILSHWITKGLVRYLASVPENAVELNGFHFWEHEVLELGGMAVPCAEDWVTGRIWHPEHIPVVREPNDYTVRPSNKCEPGSIRLVYKDGSERRLP